MKDHKDPRSIKEAITHKTAAGPIVHELERAEFDVVDGLADTDVAEPELVEESAVGDDCLALL
jgi:hypothetical protein